MTVGDLFQLALDNGFPIDANNDYELCMMDGRPVTNIAISPSDGIIYLGDADPEDEDFEEVVIV